MVGTAAVLFTNPKEEQVATKVELKGSLSDPDISTWYAVLQLLRNAFIQAIAPAIDNEVSIISVNEPEPEPEKEGFFRRIFQRKKD